MRKTFLFSFFTVFALSFLKAQVSMPQMPSSPDFPSVQAPEIGQGFYHPKVPSYTGPKNVQKTNPKLSENAEKVTESTVKSAGSSELLTDLLGNSNYLTAENLSDMSSLGILGNLSSLYSNNLYGSNITSQNSDATLEKILSALESIQKNQGTEKKISDSVNLESDINNARILRFKINGYDILDSITEVFFSQSDDDGTFLLSGDRRYVADRKMRNETFYCLFRTDGKTGQGNEFIVETEVMQDKLNENSFLYKMSREKNLVATKTGNLVTVKEKRDGMQIELLLDIGK